MYVDVWMLPQEATEKKDAVDTWLVVDVLRATTQIAAFFHGGGQVLVPVETVEDARSIAAEYGDEWLLMGERNASAPEGFGTGNSPSALFELPPHMRKKGIISTTNGVPAIKKAARTGCPVMAACIANARAAVGACSGESIGIMAAGRAGRVGFEDIICCGLLVNILLELHSHCEMGDGALVAKTIHDACRHDILSAVSSSVHGRTLISMGYEHDVKLCCTQDFISAVPQLAQYRGVPAFVA